MSSKDNNKGGYSREGFFGQINHYDKNGKKIGESRPSAWGGYNDYDANGKRIGESRPNFLGGYDNYRNGKKVSETYQSPLGWDTFDKDGKHHSYDNIIGDTIHSNASGGAMPPRDNIRGRVYHQSQPVTPTRTYTSGNSQPSTADTIYMILGFITIGIFGILILIGLIYVFG